MSKFKRGNRWLSPAEAREHRDKILAEKEKVKKLLEKNKEKEVKVETLEVETVTEEVKKEEVAKEEFKCEECGFVAKTKAGLSAHARSHK